MTIAPTTCRFLRLKDGVAMHLDDGECEVVLTDAMAAALWQALGAAIGAEPMSSPGDDDDRAPGGQEGGR